MAKLELAPSYDFELLGIVSPERAFRMAWLVNQACGISLVREKEYMLEMGNEEAIWVACYQYLTENDGYWLFKNKAVDFAGEVSPYLLPELLQYDYLLKIENITGTIVATHLRERIAAIANVQYCALLKVEELKNRDNLLGGSTAN
jgi:hypothetical protein